MPVAFTNTSPNVKIDIFSNGALSNIVAVFWIADQDGRFQTTADGYVNLGDGYGSWTEKLMELLQEAGLQPRPTTLVEAGLWLQNNNGAAAVEFLRKVWNAFIALLCAAITKELPQVQAPPGSIVPNFDVADDLFAYLIANTVFKISNGVMTGQLK